MGNIPSTPSHANISCDHYNTLFQTNSKFFRRGTTFFHRPPEKSFSFNHIYIPPKIVPHNKYAYSSHSSSRRIELEFISCRVQWRSAHATKEQEIQPADNFFATVQLPKSRHLSSSLLWYADSTCGSTVGLMQFLTLWTLRSKFEFSFVAPSYSFPTDVVGKLIIISSKFISCDHARNSHGHCVSQSFDFTRRNLMLITLKT